MVEPYTKKHIADITRFEDHIDYEYLRRLGNVKTKSDLIDLLKDYEEFLPQGMQKFRKCNQKEFDELMTQVRSFFRAVETGLGVPSEPTEAVMLCNPILLGFPRMLARKMSSERKKHISFGTAFLELFNQGLIKKMLDQQEFIYKQVILVRDYVKEVLDTRGELDGLRKSEQTIEPQ